MIEMKRIIISLIAGLLGLPLFADGYYDHIKLDLNSENGVYASGDSVIVTATVDKLPEKELLLQCFSYGRKVSQQGISLHMGTQRIFAGVFSDRESLVLKITAVSDGRSGVSIGFLVDPEKFLPGFATPKDLRGYWDGELARMRKVRPVVKTYPAVGVSEADSAAFECYRIEINMPDGNPCRGYVAYPRCAAPGTLPIYMLFHGAGVNRPHNYATASNVIENAKLGCIALDINAHGFMDDQPQAYYDKLNSGELRHYPLKDFSSKDDYYFHNMYLRDVRALDYAVTLPQWDGKRVLVKGNSQGGGQALAVAGIDSRVTHCCALVPALTDMGGRLDGRKSGWPASANNEKCKTPLGPEVLAYHDGAVLVSLFKGNLYIEAGNIDTTCDPAAVSAAYNNAASASSRQIVYYPHRPHGSRNIAPAWHKDWEEKVEPLQNKFIKDVMAVSVPEHLSLTAAHPRLILDDKALSAIKKAVAAGENEALVKMHSTYMDFASSCVEGAHKFEFIRSGSVPSRLLPVSRKALGEMAACAYAYRFSGEKKYLERALAVVEDVCSFPSWNPSHYLDVAEMALGVSIVYDWLYKKMPAATRAMCEKALTEYFFDTAETMPYRERFLMKGNWAQVLNASLLSASVALWDKDPARCEALLRRAVADIQPAMERVYAPDGIYPEGPMYWGYGTSYQLVAVEALGSAFGSDFGLSLAQGFRQSAMFMLFATGNIGLAFNYGDAGPKRESVPALWYFAGRFGEGGLVAREYGTVASGQKYKLSDRLGFMYVMQASRCNVKDLKAPQQKLFSGSGNCPLVMARTGWERDDIYLGAKGGKAVNGHGHMDAGSFVYEDRGVRWVREASAPGYEKTERLMKSLGGNLWKMGQESLRWKMYGYNNAQHSTLTLNGHDHDCRALATLLETYDTPEKRGGLFDLSPVYAADAKSVTRGIYIADSDHLEVIDCIAAPDTADVHVRWNLVTDASVQLTPQGVVLSAKDKKMLLHAEGCPLEYTTDISVPENTPSEFAPFYEKNQRFAAFTFVVPAGQSVSVKTRLERL